MFTRLTLATTLGCLLTTPLAFAQDAQVEANATQDSETKSARMEKMQVTGSFIKRTDTEGPSPVQVLDKDYLDKTGYNSVGDVLREVGANSFGSARENSGSNAAGSSTVNLRGLGASRTLVLLDGYRLPKDGVLDAANLNLIPMSVIERVDILKDGASALYGSDALGGVVNIVTRKDFTGLDLEVKQELAREKGGQKTTASITYGDTFEKGRFFTTLQFRNNGPVFSRDRDYLSSPGASINAPNANYVNAGGDLFKSPTCAASTTTDVYCRYDYNQEASRTPSINQLNTYSEVRYDINSDTELFASVKATQSLVKWNYAPGVVNDIELTADATNSYANLPSVNLGEKLTPYWRSLALGNRDTEITEKSWGVNIGAKHYMFETWEIEGRAGIQKIRREDIGVSGYAKKDSLAAVLQRGNTAGGFDPFTNTGSTSDLESTRYKPEEIVSSQVSSVEVRANGEVYETSNGPIAAAIGAGTIHEEFTDIADKESLAGNVTGGGSSSNAEGARDSQFLFSEFSVPVAEKAEMQIAARYDNYSDFGDTINPKLAVKYRPTGKILLRASAGTGFKAPALTSMYEAESKGVQNFVDTASCEAYKKDPTRTDLPTNPCKANQYETRTTGNKDLKEETSESFNAGIVYEHSKSFDISLDYFFIKLKDKVGISYVGIMEADHQAGAPTASRTLDSKTTITREGSKNRIKLVDTSPINVGTNEIQGLDVAMHYKFHINKIGSFKITNNLSYMLKYMQQNHPLIDSENVVSTAGAPKWKNQTSLDWKPSDKITTTLSMNVTQGYEKVDEDEGDIGRHTRFDLQIGYFLSQNSKLTFGIFNLFNNNGPLDETAQSPYNEELYDPIGQRASIAYNHSF